MRHTSLVVFVRAIIALAHRYPATLSIRVTTRVDKAATTAAFYHLSPPVVPSLWALITRPTRVHALTYKISAKSDTPRLN